ncbi:MAG TPA: hypothetical protein VNG13_06590 [Mycobacteriales bacterium]|nr:hypothetical protein [Mycobacteriales bacterium]
MPALATLGRMVGRPGRTSSAALALSGIAIAAMPRRTAATLGLTASSARGLAETRAGLGGTFAGLGLWAFARGSSDAYTAVGMTWLGAAALRLAALRLDRPDPDWSYWAYLAAELSLGVGAVAAGGRRAST